MYNILCDSVGITPLPNNGTLHLPLAPVGVHGEPVEFHIERLWSRNITLTTRLVDTVTTPMLLRIVQSGRLDAKKLVSHRFELSEIMKAYDTFENAAEERALKVVLKNASTCGVLP